MPKMIDKTKLKKQALSAFLKEQRNKRDWSQREAARRMGVTHATLHAWESERSIADRENIGKIGNLFGYQPWEVMKILGDDATDRETEIRKVIDSIETLSSEEVLQVLAAATNRMVRDAAKKTSELIAA